MSTHRFGRARRPRKDDAKKDEAADTSRRWGISTVPASKPFSLQNLTLSVRQSLKRLFRMDGSHTHFLIDLLTSSQAVSTFYRSPDEFLGAIKKLSYDEASTFHNELFISEITHYKRLKKIDVYEHELLLIDIVRYPDSATLPGDIVRPQKIGQVLVERTTAGNATPHASVASLMSPSQTNLIALATNTSRPGRGNTPPTPAAQVTSPTEEPAAQESIPDQPTANLPTADPPTADPPTADPRTTDPPTADPRTADPPPADLPTADQPTADQHQPASDRPTADDPAPSSAAHTTGTAGSANHMAITSTISNGSLPPSGQTHVPALDTGSVLCSCVPHNIIIYQRVRSHRDELLAHSSRGVPLARLCAAMIVVAGYRPGYELMKYNCYWYAAVIGCLISGAEAKNPTYFVEPQVNDRPDGAGTCCGVKLVPARDVQHSIDALKGPYQAQIEIIDKIYKAKKADHDALVAKDGMIEAQQEVLVQKDEALVQKDEVIGAQQEALEAKDGLIGTLADENQRLKEQLAQFMNAGASG